jgi:hypothetical protein
VRASALMAAEEDAMNYLYGGGDETIECHKMRWVNTRFPHVCCSLYHGDNPLKIMAGSRVVLESAKVDGRFGTAYTCTDCVNRAIRELSR